MNQSSFHVIAGTIRAAGSKDPVTGIIHGGIYYPANIDRDGKQISGRWEGQFFINQLGYNDSEGNFHEAKNIPIRLTAWNGKNSAAGKGLADIFAKCVSKGKELSAALRMDYYDKKLYINGVPQIDHTGQPIKVPSYGWLIKSDLQWGEDASNVVAQEIANWANQINFFSRPPLWNVQNTPDNETWKAVVAHRMATVYQGEPTYGYSRVMLPEGARPIYAPGPAIGRPEGLPQTGQQYPTTLPGMSPSGMVAPLPPMSQINQTTAPPVTGPTLAQLIGAGWHPDQIKADPRFAHLVQQTTYQIPPVPQAPPIPQAPPVAAGPTYAQLIGAGWNDAQIKADPRFAHLAPFQTGAPPTSAATYMIPGATPMTNTTGL